MDWLNTIKSMKEYIFNVYDCDDEASMKIVKQFRQKCADAESAKRYAKVALNATNTTADLAETAWIEIAEVIGTQSRLYVND